MKASLELLSTLKDISRRINDLYSDPARHELDPDALADLALARKSVENLVDRVERLVN